MSLVYEPSFSPPIPKNRVTSTSSDPMASSSSSPLRNSSLNNSRKNNNYAHHESRATCKSSQLQQVKSSKSNGVIRSVVVDVALASPSVRPTTGSNRSSMTNSTSNGEISMIEYDQEEENRRKMLLIIDDEDDPDDDEEELEPEREDEERRERDVKIEVDQQEREDDQDDDDDIFRSVLHVEVRLKPAVSIHIERLRSMVLQYFSQSDTSLLRQNSELSPAWKDVPILGMYIDRIWIAESDHPSDEVPLSEVDLDIHIYQPSTAHRTSDCFISPNDDDDSESTEQDGPAASVLDLPSISLEGIWDNLVYEEPVKENLLSYINSSMEFSDHGIDFNIVSWNRVCLLHGPPGSGKTSLCRALAQKLAIRLSDTYSFGRLIEINSHSLFSKWFSESGKLVQKLFASVTEMVEDEDGFAVVLIDEVESLTAARAGAMSGKEPSDALRVVNALLTQLDKLKTKKNCLVITTSNLSEAIDPAFIDRADIKQYVGLPPPPAIYWILRSSLKEMMDKQMIRNQEILTYAELTNPSTVTSQKNLDAARRLLRLATEAKGMSGRTLRKLPILAHAKYLANKGGRRTGKIWGLSKWLEGIEFVVKEEKRQRSLIDGTATEKE